jgi:16S rRNA (adenine1518-N6/adenine1519-N6)-dimethyltransferase
MKLSEMKQVLAANDIQLTKSLGQNFLHDGNQLKRIVAAADLRLSDKVLEIGPGLGPLTEALLEAAGEVLAIEKDVRLVKFLRQRFKTQLENQQNGATPKHPVLDLLSADALEYVKHPDRDWSGWKLVSNLPYSVASPILVELAQSAPGPDRMVATLQTEVAKRLVANVKTEDYGVLTLLIQLDYQPLGFFKIPAGCFFPEPEVDSACVSLVRREKPLLPSSLKQAFTRVVKRSFSQRRKMMLKLLKSDWPEEALKPAFEELDIPLQARGETISLEQYVRLTRLLHSDSVSETKQA